jgi:hypothetical protein
VADQAGAFDPDGVQEGHHVDGEVIDGVAAVRPLGVAVAALVQRVGVVAHRQQGQDPAPGEPRVGVAGQEDDRLPARVALLGVVDPRTAAKMRGGKPKLRNLLLHAGLSLASDPAQGAPSYGGDGEEHRDTIGPAALAVA